MDEAEKAIKKERNRLKKLFEEVPERQLKAVDKLLDNAAFMAWQLQQLRETIIRDGPVAEYQNGANQSGTRKSPEADLYNTMLKNYAGVIKQLTDLLPSGAAVHDPLLEFMTAARMKK